MQDHGTGSKVCTACGERKPLDDFTPRQESRDGRRGKCRECEKPMLRANAARWRALNPEKAKAAERRFREANRGLLSAKAIKRRRQREFGLTPEAFDAMVARQEGACAVCRRRVAQLCIDHDHDTGQIRGLLCHSCNRGIGLLGDSEARLRVALSYLENPSSHIERFFEVG